MELSGVAFQQSLSPSLLGENAFGAKIGGTPLMYEYTKILSVLEQVEMVSVPTT
jgi:hypothetical protein